MFLHCPNCNAPIDQITCNSCGQETDFLSKVEEDIANLARFKKKFNKSPNDEAVKLLVYGFMPRSSEVLLTAGLDMVSLIQEKELDQNVLDAANGRLSAISARLKLLGSTKEAITMALEIFEHDVTKHDRRARIWAIIGVVGLMLVCGIFLWL